MAGEWRKCTLGDALILQRGFDLPVDKRLPGHYPVIASTGQVGTHNEAMVKGPGVVIGRSGSIGGGQFIQTDFWPLNTTLFIKDYKGNDTRFCYYLLKSLDFSGYNVGSGVPTLNRNHIHPLPVYIPPLSEQRAIAHILGTLDDKIELNRRMNETLEGMARAIFKSWFVDFDPVRAKAESKKPHGMDPATAALFPDSFQPSPFGPIPQGWEVKSIEDLAKRVGMGPFGSSIKVSTFVPDGIPIISGQHLNNTMLEDNQYNYITLDHAEKLKNSNVFRGDVVFTHAGSIGQVAYIPETSFYDRYVISQRQFYMRCDLSKVSPIFIINFFKTPEGQHKLLANTSSTGVPSISRPVSYLKTIKLVTPSKLVMDAFNKLIRPLYFHMSNNITQSKNIAKTRDALLPKLLTGQLKT